MKTNTRRKFYVFLNLLFSEEFPNAGEAALLTLALEFESLLWLPLELAHKGANEERFMFRAAAVRPAGGKSGRVLAATGLEWLDWSDKFEFKFWLLSVSNWFWSKATDLLRKLVFKSLLNIPSDLSPNMLIDVVAIPFKKFPEKIPPKLRFLFSSLTIWWGI